MTQKDQRIAHWDNLKGFLILLTVFAHILFQLQESNTVIDHVVDLIYLFHMPAFVFVSGFFGKSQRSRGPEAIAGLLFLFFVFHTFLGFLYGFESLLKPMYSYWYLIALIVWRLTAPYLAGRKGILPILLFISVVAGFYPGIDNTLAISRIICFYPYYLAGYSLSMEKSEQFIRKSIGTKIPAGLLLLLGGTIASWTALAFFRYSDDALQMAPYEATVDAFGRMSLYLIAYFMILSLRFLMPDKKIPFLTMIGRNSLCIFILHRPLTLLISDRLTGGTAEKILGAAFAAVLLCLFLGSDRCEKIFEGFRDSGAQIFTRKSVKKLCASRIMFLLAAFFYVLFASLHIMIDFPILRSEAVLEEETLHEDLLYPVLSDDMAQEFENAFRITFAGDLLLLEDQVKRGLREDGYDFYDVFEYAKKYIGSADYAIGVLEGPLAGGEAGYSTSNFDDNKELHLNFPDSFAYAIQESGFDLVTTANNHLLDRGEAGALRTIQVLEEIGLDHTGSYRSAQEKEQSRVKLVECEGIKMAILSYTYGCNDVENAVLERDYAYLTSVIGGTRGRTFEERKAAVENDFREAKSYDPDLIIVLPHIGTQFSNYPDREQETWFRIFRENGADVILGDHPHAVQPITLEQRDGRTVFEACCPGNFANCYRDDQGDTSMLIDVYIDRVTKQIIGGSIVPLYTQSPADGNYRALPIYEILHNKELRAGLSTDDLERAQAAHAVITKVVFGNAMDFSAVSERYYFTEEGFLRSRVTGLEWTQEMENGILYSALKDAESICFIGDSVTEGTKNGGCPWYEPIEEFVEGKNILQYAKGGCTVSYMVQHAASIPEAQVYVIALGTNDVRYRDQKVCAMTAQEYVSGLSDLRESLRQKSPDAKFVFLAPWYSADGDLLSALSYREKYTMNREYSEALMEYCRGTGDDYINANDYIEKVLSREPEKQYLLDAIHPNAGQGVLLYSEAALRWQR